MNRVLEQIVEKKREDLGEKKKRISLEKLKESVKELLRNEKQGGMRFFDSLSVAQNDIAIIAEVKFASPSNGIPACRQAGLRNDISKDLVKRVKEYEAAGADAISIITEPHFFKGSVDFIGKVKETVKLSILQKDFVIDEYQIYESARLRQGFGGQAGADALLLISRLVDGKTLKQFVELCLTEEIEPVVEIYSEEDLEKAVATKTRFIAVNSRDLDTLEVDVKRACELMKKIPERFVRLGFSGIQSAREVRKYWEAGARGVLVGTALMKTDKIEDFILSLRGVRSERGSNLYRSPRSPKATSR